MAQSFEYLSQYLDYEDLNESSMVLTFVETEEINEVLPLFFLDSTVLPWDGEKIPWNGRTCCVILNHVTKLLTSSDHHGILRDTITRLEYLASEHQDLLCKWPKNSDEIPVRNLEIVKIFKNSFVPEVKKFFSVPQLQHLPDKDKFLKGNEILAGFMDFLLQILYCEALASSDEVQRYALLSKELKYVLTFLGDIPFQCNELELVNNILFEFEIVANEVGTFIYSYVLATHGVNASRFYGARDSLFELVVLLNGKIKEHCINFSELPRCIIPKANVIDSLFIVDSLLKDLENVIDGRFNLCIDDIKDHAKTIHKEMTLARAFLKDIEVGQDAYNDQVKESCILIRDVAYEAEYLFSSYVVGNVPFWYLVLRLPAIVQYIKLLGITVQEIKKMDDTKALKVKKDFDRKLSFQVVETHMDANVEDNALVGFADEKIRILADLTGGSMRRQIISIIGLPGLGKTTIANKLFNDRSSCEYFDQRAWCVVSQTYQKKNVLMGIFMSLSASKSEKPDKEAIMKLEDDKLGLEIHKRLMGRRYLIVLDDVWHSTMWDDLKRYFPDDAIGSRILLTSRIKDTAPSDSIFHPLHLLSETQSWDLLRKKVFCEKPCPPHLLVIGKGIAAKCHGLPLAVVVIAGILAKLENEASLWTKVETNLASYMFDDPSRCLKILELSYEYLPNHLKLCFLYFGAFPEDADVRAQKLIRLWVAEGFIPKQEEKNPEILANEYLFDLINRSLVMIVKRRFDGGIKSCNMHDLLHDMCLRKAHMENFIKCIKNKFSIYEKHQRLCVHSTANNYSTQRNGIRDNSSSFGPYCRSLFGNLLDPSPGFSHMGLLRVMDLFPWKITLYEPTEIYLLVNLRYLSVHAMPLPIVDNLVNLEVLDVDHSDTLKLSFILKMVKLRHLHKKSLLLIEKDCDSYQTTNLMSLGYVAIRNSDDEEILRRSPYLCKIKCLCDGTMFPDLYSLTQLESLNMSYSSHFEGELTEIYFPSTIKKLTLNRIGLSWEEMSIIGRLPNLQYLKLVSNAFLGEEWATKDGEFEELRFLILEYCNPNQWITCSEHFPKLQCLVLNTCLELEEMPSDLGNISTLQKIEVNYSSYNASISAVRIEKEQREYENEQLKVIIENSDWSKEQLIHECEEMLI